MEKLDVRATMRQESAVPTDLPPELLGLELAGNDLGPDELADWYADEERGYYEVYDKFYSNQGDGYDQIALNWWQGRSLTGKHFPVALALGCAEGHDIASLPITADRYIAIEPTPEYWSSIINGKPAEYRRPNVTGEIDLIDGSVDFVCAIGVLHHIANVEFVIGELARVLRPGGYIFVREPAISMGDFRFDRPGLTKRERGIPIELMRKYLSQSGIQVQTCYRSSITPMAKIFQRLHIKKPSNYRAYVLLDAILSNLLAFNARYYRPGLFDKIAPSSMTYIGRKSPI